jgi:transposase
MTVEEGEQLKKQLAQALQQNRLLQEQIRLLLRQKFGSKNEQLDSRQLELMMQLAELQQREPEEDDDPPPSPRSRKKRPKRKPRLPEHLPVQIETIIPDEVKNDPGSFKQIGEEVTEELDVIPLQYFIRRIVRLKYVDLRDRQRPPLIAPLAPRPIEGGYASAGLLSDIAVKKYRDHLPLYRQGQILRYQSIDLSRQTMSDWMEKVSEWLKPIYNHIGNQLRAGPYLQVDETPIQYCGAEGGGSRKGYLWVYNDPRGDVLYQWHASRAAWCLEPMLKEFKGTIQSDGYGAYPSYAKGREDLELSACWAHARRKFFDARKEAPRVAGWLLKQIGLLYSIEAQLRASHAGPELRTAVRQAQSQMIVRRIGKALNLKLGQYLPQSGMGKAINYSLGLWSALSLYLDNGLLEIDNNLVENAIRPTALGKKNWMFFGSEDSGQRSAIIYTILENCKRQGIDPGEYLKDVLTRFPGMDIRDAATLTPANWLAARSAVDQAA